MGYLAIYAVRRALFRAIPEQAVLDDVFVPLDILSRGYRVMFSSSAIAWDVFSPDMDSEWKRKVRTLAGNWQLLFDNGMLGLSCKRHFVFRLFWHKISRLLVPFALVVLLGCSFALGSCWALLFGWGQVVFYLSALLAYFFCGLRANSLIRLCYFFCVLNLAAAAGLWVWLSGQCGTVWKRNETSAI